MPTSPVVTGAAPPSLLDHAIAAGTATFDFGLRTGLVALLSASFAPVLLSGRSVSFEYEQLDFYADFAHEHDATRTFVEPAAGVAVRARAIRPPVFARGVGGVDLLTFESPFRTLNPALRQSYESHRRNRIARAQHWRHAEGDCPTMIVIHGFMGSPAVFNAAFFSLPWFYSHGYDVLLVTLPFHGRRADRTSPYSGHGFFAHGLAHLNEAVLQGVSDVRTLVRYVLDSGSPRVGVTGLSLGGYTTAALAAAEPRLHFAIPNAAVVELSSLIRSWVPAGQMLDVALHHRGGSFDDLRDGLAVHSALTYAPMLPKERLFIIGGLGDRLAPPDQSRQLWEHWDRCRLHWYPGNHIMHVNRADYLREMGRFLNATGFSAAA